MDEKQKELIRELMEVLMDLPLEKLKKTEEALKKFCDQCEEKKQENHDD